jgi:hypothetical protein
LKICNLVFFISEGEPYDLGYNLIGCKDEIIKTAKSHVDNISYYTPRILRELGFEYFVKEYDELGCSVNPNMHKLGFETWKPLIMKLELEKLNDGDILIYRDSNTEAYPGLLMGYDKIRTFSENMLDSCKFDFFIIKDFAADWIPNTNFVQKSNCKTKVLRELGENHEFSYEFPVLTANNIIVRKSLSSMELIKEWVSASKNEKWATGLYNEYPHHEDFMYHTNGQALINVIIANWIRKRKYDIPIDFPKFRNKCPTVMKNIVGKWPDDSTDPLEDRYFKNYIDTRGNIVEVEEAKDFNHLKYL